MQELVELAGTGVKYDSTVLSAEALRTILDPYVGPPRVESDPIIPSSIQTADDAFSFAWRKMEKEQPDLAKRMEVEGKSREDLLAEFKSVLEGPLPDDLDLARRPKWSVRCHGGQYIHTLGDKDVLVTENAVESKALELIFKGVEVVFDLAMLLLTVFSGAGTAALVVPETEDAEAAARADVGFVNAIKTFLKTNTGLLNVDGLKGTKNATKWALGILGWFRGFGGVIPKAVSVLTAHLKWYKVASIGLSVTAGLALLIGTAGGSTIGRIVACAVLLGLTVADIIWFSAIALTPSTAAS